MKILALDTTGLAASVAIVDEEKTVAEFTTNFKKTHSETIMPMVDNIFSITGMELSEMDAIACSSGPGSFTGLRIGIATAKGLAFGANLRLVPVPTLDAIAYNVFKSGDLVVPLMDARRNQAYTAFYECEINGIKRLTEYMALDIDEIIKMAGEFGKNVIFLGDGAAAFKAEIERSSLGFSFAPPHMNMQRASSVGSLGIVLAKSGHLIAGHEFKPFYLRKSQAERERDERTGLIK